MTQQVTSFLHQLEQQLKDDDLWSDIQPSPERLASSQPFAIDSLTIAEWLQFIFIAKFRLLVENKQSLPANINITPIIEQNYTGNKSAVTNIVEQIEKACLSKPH